MIRHGALHTQLVHHIPFKPLGNGRLNLPLIRIQYFDPGSGKIIAATHYPHQTFVIDLVWRVIIGGLIGVLVILLGKVLYQKYFFIRHRWQLRKAAFHEINTAETYAGLRDALNLLANAEGWPNNLTIRRWVIYWTSCFKQNDGFDDFDDLMKQLSRACYCKEPMQDLEAFRSRLIDQLLSSKRIRKYRLQIRSV